MQQGFYAHCVRPLLSVVELGLVWAWNSEAESTLFTAWSCMWVSGRIGSKRALTLFFKQRESKHIHFQLEDYTVFMFYDLKKNI